MTNNKFEFISLDEAYARLLDKYPEQKNKILINEDRFKGAIKTLRQFYQYESALLTKKDSLIYQDLFCDNNNLITKKAYDYFSQRIEEFNSLLDEVKVKHDDFPVNSSLTTITTICPIITKSKRHTDKDNRLLLTEFITEMDNLYLRLPLNSTLTLNNYCWLLGSFYSIDRMSKYNIIDHEKNIIPFGYQDCIEINSHDNNLKLFKIDRSCIEYDNEGILVKKVIINNKNDLSIDCIDGGILTNLPLRPDFYYYLNTPMLVNFFDIYVIENDARLIFESVKISELDNFHNYPKDKKRVEIIKYALENNLLEVDTFTGHIPTYKHKKAKLFDFLRLNEDISIKFKNENKSLFSTNADEFFKTCKEVKTHIKFKSGRPKKIE